MTGWRDATVIDPTTGEPVNPPSVFNQTPAEPEQARPQPEIIYQEPGTDNRVVRLSNDALQYVSPGFSSSDPDFIADFMGGQGGAGRTREWVNDAVIDGNPVAARLTQYVEGVPGVGSYLDDAIGAIAGEEAGSGVRAISNAMEENHPVQSGALGLAGTITSLPLFSGAANATIGRMATSANPAVSSIARALTFAPNAHRGTRIAQGTGLGLAGGATEGAIYGYGEQGGEGRLANAGSQAAFGAGAGAIFGGLAPATFDGVRAAYNYIRSTPINDAAQQLGTTPEVVQLFSQLMDDGRIDEAMAVAGRRADDMLAYDLPEVADYVAANSGAAGGAVRRAIAGDTAERTARFAGAMDDTLGSPEGRLTLQTNIMDDTRAGRSAAYDGAFAQPIDYASEAGQRLEGMLNRVPNDALRRAELLMRTNDELSPQRLFRIADDGTVEVVRMPDVREWNYITRALRDTARNDFGQVVGDLAQSRDRLGAEIRNLLGSDDLVPEYRAALDAGADAIGRREAVDTGRRLLEMPTDEAEFVISRMSNDAERTAARQGLRSFIDQRIQNVRAVASRPSPDDQIVRQAEEQLRQLSSPQSRANITALLGPEDAARFFTAFDELQRGLGLQASTARNSATFGRQAMDRLVTEAASPSAINRFTDLSTPIDSMRVVGQAITGSLPDATQAQRMEILDQIASALINQRGDDAMGALRIVNQARLGANVSDENAMAVARALSAVTSGGGSQGTLQMLGMR